MKPPRPTTGKRKQKPDRPLEDGTTEVFYEVHSDEVVVWPMLKDKSDAKVIEEAGTLLWMRALQNPDDTLLVGAVRVMHALWVMIRARDDRARSAMLELEKLCIDYRDARYLDTEEERARTTDPAEKDKLGWRDRWSMSELPPRAWV